MINIDNKNILIINQLDLAKYDLSENNDIKILILDKLVGTIKSLYIYDYIIVDDINILLMLRKKSILIGKIIYFSEKSNLLYYCNDIKKKNKINKINYINYVDNINDSNVILYNKLSDISCNIENKILLNYDENKKILNSIITIINNSSKMKIKDIINFINNKNENENENELIVKNVNYKRYSKKIKLQCNKLYLIARYGYKIENNILKDMIKEFNNNNLLFNFKCISFIINGEQDRELIILIKPVIDMNISYVSIGKMIEFNYSISVGTNTKKLDTMSIINYYYFLGIIKNCADNIFINDVQDYYLNLIKIFKNNNEKILDLDEYKDKNFDIEKFIRSCSYYFGNNKLLLNKKKLISFYDNNKQLFNNKKIALLSKQINTYGGNQKTSIQIYNLLIRNGIKVHIIYLNAYDLYSELNSNIHNNDVKTYNINELPEIINSKYDCVIVNKLNEYFKIHDQISKKNIIITHNSLDPFNNLIKHVSKTFTVNSNNISSLYEDKNEYPISKHINYVNCDTNLKRNNSSFYNKVVFVGRFSKEKNLNLLLKAWEEVIIVYEQLQLIVIGSGDSNSVIKQKNVIFTGQLDIQSILIILMNADYLIVPSYTEGLPFSILEAMSVGTPVITTDIIGCNELVIHNHTGFLSQLAGYDNNKFNITKNWNILYTLDEFKYENIKNLKNTILKAYLIDNNKWRQMSNNCYELVKTQYNYEISKNNVLKNIKYDKNILIIGNNIITSKIFDVKNIINNDDYEKYEIIISCENIDKIQDIMIMLSKLYRIRHECEIKKSNKIIDEMNNFIIFVNCYNNIINVESIFDLLSY